MIDWLTILIALIIIIGLVAFFGLLAWKINQAESLTEENFSSDSTGEKRKSQDQNKKKRKEQKKNKTNSKVKSKEPSVQTSEETEDENEESEQESLLIQTKTDETNSKAKKRNKNKNSNEKNSLVVPASSVMHPKSANKEENGNNKSQGKVQTKQGPTPAVQPMDKKSKVNDDDDQPFTVVGSNKNKNSNANASIQQNKTTTPVPPTAPVKEGNRVAPSTKLGEVAKNVPSSQVAVAELMLALDAFPLSADELEIIMHKITNKQAMIKQDWSKFQTTKKLDVPSAGDSSQDTKNNSLKRLKELSDELNSEKIRCQQLFKEKVEKEREIETLRNQLQSKSTNVQVRQEIDDGNVQFRVLSEQMKKLSVENANLEKKAGRFESMVDETKREKENLQRNNEQLTESLEKIQKQLQTNEDKLESIEKRCREEINEYKIRYEQLEKENEQLRNENIVHVEPSLPTEIKTIDFDTEEREKLEKEIEQLKENQHSNEKRWQEKSKEFERIKSKLDDVEIEREKLAETLKKEQEEFGAIDRLCRELKTNQQAMIEENRRVLIEILPQEIRSKLSESSTDFQQWISTYRTILQTHLDAVKKTFDDQTSTLKLENERLQKNMTDVENQLKEIEQTVQTKEELLLSELKTKDALLEDVRQENEHLRVEVQRIRSDINVVQSAHDALVKEARALKVQLDERFLVAANTPIAVADESFELIKQPSPSLSPIVVDIRAEQLNELIRTSNEPLENQESVTQQLVQQFDDFHRVENEEVNFDDLLGWQQSSLVFPKD